MSKKFRVFKVAMFLVLVATMLTGCFGIFSKDKEWTVEGVVKDRDGNPIKDATIILKYAKKSAKTESDEEGKWSAKVSGDSVKITVNKPGYKFEPAELTVKKDDKKAIEFVGTEKLVLSLSPIEDAYVRGGGYASTNFGDSEQLQLKYEANNEDNTRVIFLKFDISEIESVEEATLRLFLEFNDVLEFKTLAFYDITGQEWSEAEITWENAPLEGGTHIRDAYTDNFSNVWLNVNITDMVRKHVEAGTKVISIRINHRDDHWGGTIFAPSREAAANNPELVIVQ